jgi:hypothetical protein
MNDVDMHHGTTAVEIPCPSPNVTPKKSRTSRQSTPDPASIPTPSSPSCTLRSHSGNAATPRKSTLLAATAAIPKPASTPSKPKSTPSKSKPIAKPATHVYRVLASEVPEDVGGLQVHD